MTISKSPRAAPGRYPRGEETRRRIIDVAIASFGRQGFAGTSTRDVAAAAKVNTPAIQYYFGGKQGLYDACIDYLTGMVWHRIRPPVEACQAGTVAGAGLDEVTALLTTMQGCLIDSFFSDHEGLAIRRLLAWEDAEDGENASDQFMKTRIGLPVFKTFRQAVESILVTPMPAIEVDMHSLSLMGLSMIFHFDQSRVMDRLHWTMDDETLTTLKSVAGRQLAFALVGLSRPLPRAEQG